jgi:hypothetical protein
MIVGKNRNMSGVHVTRKKRSARTGLKPNISRMKKLLRYERTDVVHSTWTIPGLAHEDKTTIITGEGGAAFLRTLAVALAAGEPLHGLKAATRGPKKVLIATNRDGVADSLVEAVNALGYVPGIRITIQSIAFHDDGELGDPSALARTAKMVDPTFLLLEGLEGFHGPLFARAHDGIRNALGDLSCPILAAMADFDPRDTGERIVLPLSKLVKGLQS